MLISVIIPCYNEIHTIDKIIDLVNDQKEIDKEIILVDDCSSDGTKELIENDIFKKVDMVIYHKKNYGKGAAVRSGIKNSSGDIILIQDADLEYNPENYSVLLKPIIDNRADVVYGSRFIGPGQTELFIFGIVSVIK